ncbi:MAG: 50S ribosomal protein L11 methyltransferase [Deltaproteobacteria bacterium]|nr:50S ribosomal protein L11 methyltransferase [Deltaproteobacteria bacterium]
MRADELLTIYEIRAKEPQDLEFLGLGQKELLGPDLAGLHLEGDFAFLFFVHDFDLKPFLSAYPKLTIEAIHRLRYDQWRDGDLGGPLELGPLSVWPGPLGPAPLGDQKVLYIDPGLAFGYGGHPTTKSCLKFLVRLLAPKTLAPPSMTAALDLGSGTGVLGLAAALLGVKNVLGVDHSHLAVDQALKNVALNGLEERVKFVQGLAQDYSNVKGELLMANVPLFVQKDLIAAGAYDDRSYAIFSGVLTEEGEAFYAALRERRPFKVIDFERCDRWLTGLLEL